MHQQSLFKSLVFHGRLSALCCSCVVPLVRLRLILCLCVVSLRQTGVWQLSFHSWNSNGPLLFIFSWHQRLGLLIEEGVPPSGCMGECCCCCSHTSVCTAGVDGHCTSCICGAGCWESKELMAVSSLYGAYGQGCASVMSSLPRQLPQSWPSSESSPPPSHSGTRYSSPEEEQKRSSFTGALHHVRQSQTL